MTFQCLDNPGSFHQASFSNYKNSHAICLSLKVQQLMPLWSLPCQKGCNRLQPASPMQRLLIPAWTACRLLTRNLEMIPATWTRSAGSNKLWLDSWCQRELGHSVDAWSIITQNCLEADELQMCHVHSCQTDECLCVSNGFKRTKICKLQAIQTQWLVVERDRVCKITPRRIWQRKMEKTIITLSEIPCSRSVVSYKTCEINIWHASTGGKYVSDGIFKLVSPILVFRVSFSPANYVIR